MMILPLLQFLPQPLATSPLFCLTVPFLIFNWTRQKDSGGRSEGEGYVTQQQKQEKKKTPQEGERRDGNLSQCVTKEGAGMKEEGREADVRDQGREIK
jgi:hypothetical protein